MLCVLPRVCLVVFVCCAVVVGVMGGFGILLGLSFCVCGWCVLLFVCFRLLCWCFNVCGVVCLCVGACCVVCVVVCCGLCWYCVAFVVAVDLRCLVVMCVVFMFVMWLCCMVLVCGCAVDVLRAWCCVVVCVVLIVWCVLLLC